MWITRNHWTVCTLRNICFLEWRNEITTVVPYRQTCPLYTRAEQFLFQKGLPSEIQCSWPQFLLLSKLGVQSACIIIIGCVCTHADQAKPVTLTGYWQAATDLQIQVTLSRNVVLLIKASSPHCNKLVSVAVSSPGWHFPGHASSSHQIFRKLLPKGARFPKDEDREP